MQTKTKKKAFEKINYKESTIDNKLSRPSTLMHFIVDEYKIANDNRKQKTKCKNINCNREIRTCMHTGIHTNKNK